PLTKRIRIPLGAKRSVEARRNKQRFRSNVEDGHTPVQTTSPKVGQIFCAHVRMCPCMVSFHHLRLGDPAVVTLPEPEKVSLGRYIDFEPGATEAVDLDRRLHFVHLYPSRSFDLRYIKQRGSERSFETWLWGNGKNLWSVLLNLQGRRAVDDRYDTIVQ